MPWHQHSIRQFGLWVIVLTLSACAKPPLEEIASAEAALQAARDAQAPEYAPEPYQEAESLMTDTYRLNDNKDYENARTTAVDTRDKAEEARDIALQRRAEGETDAPEADAISDSGDGGRIDAKTAEETRAQVESEAIGTGAMDDGNIIESLAPVYFAFDAYTVEPSEVSKVETAADWLKENPAAVIQIEGHTDERGSADYNLALGARRAKSVQKLLVTLGVPEAQIRTRSYGEESPADPGHDEAAWAKNRRADFVVVQ